MANEAVAIADIRKRNEVRQLIASDIAAAQDCCGCVEHCTTRQKSFLLLTRTCCMRRPGSGTLLQAWLKSVGMEDAKLKGGAKPEKRDDLLALAKKGFPEYEKPSALAVCGGQVKVAPTNSWGTPATAPATIKAQREASAQALWPAPAPALKKTQDTELARIHKECEAYEKVADTHVDAFVYAHESPHSAYPQAHSYEYGAVGQHNMHMHYSQTHVPIQPTHGGFSAGAGGLAYVPYY